VMRVEQLPEPRLLVDRDRSQCDVMQVQPHSPPSQLGGQSAADGRRCPESGASCSAAGRSATERIRPALPARPRGATTLFNVPCTKSSVPVDKALVGCALAVGANPIWSQKTGGPDQGQRTLADVRLVA